MNIHLQPGENLFIKGLTPIMGRTLLLRHMKEGREMHKLVVKDFDEAITTLEEWCPKVKEEKEPTGIVINGVVYKLTRV